MNPASAIQARLVAVRQADEASPWRTVHERAGAALLGEAEAMSLRTEHVQRCFDATLAQAAAYDPSAFARLDAERFASAQAYWAQRGARLSPLSEAFQREPALIDALCSIPDAVQGEGRALANLGLLLLTGGTHLFVPAGCSIEGAVPPDRESPVGGPFSALVIELGESARLELLDGCARERLVTGPLTTRRTLVRLGRGARLARTEVSVRSGADQHALTTFELEPLADLLSHEVWLGAANAATYTEASGARGARARLEICTIAGGDSEHRSFVRGASCARPPGASAVAADAALPAFELTIRARALALQRASAGVTINAHPCQRHQVDVAARALDREASAFASILGPAPSDTPLPGPGDDAETFYLASRGLGAAARRRAQAQSALHSTLAALPDPIAVDLLTALDRLDPCPPG